MHIHADRTKEYKSRTVANTASQIQNGRASAFQPVDNRPEAVLQGKLQETVNNSLRVKQLKAFQEMANQNQQNEKVAQLQVKRDSHPYPLIIQRQFDPPNMADGFKQGLKTSTIDRFGVPSLKLGSWFSFSLLGSALIAPLLTDRPTVPSVIKSFASGFAGGFLSGTVARKFMFNAIGIPGVVDNLITVSNFNKTAVKLDEYLVKNPDQISVAEKFRREVSERASEQHKRTNPYMTPSSPESMAEIHSPFGG